MNRIDKILFVCVVLIAFALAAAVAQRMQLRLHPPMQRLAVTPEQVIGTLHDFKGDVNSPYTLVEFGDYQCGPCAQQESNVKELLTQNPGRIKLAFRNHPLPFHRFGVACKRSGGNRAATGQILGGSRRFVRLQGANRPESDWSHLQAGEYTKYEQ